MCLTCKWRWALAATLLLSPIVYAETSEWSRTLERISSGVVSLRVDATRAFDTGRNQSSQATGFVVDAEAGLILTNRHVVTAGPVRAEALFLNQEEVSLVPVYRDPVHDFGLFRYDPAALRYITPTELKLAPQRAAVGIEVRIVGNDAGEQLSILSGTIARLNRRAPFYGYGNYNDFNTFYIQAATGSSGGSSGSPVLDRDGYVVALNAGASSSAASSFFLPLQRVERAVELIRAGKEVPRGTLQVQFVQLPFDELRRLGMREATEADFRARFPQQNGVLVVSNIMRGSRADGVLQVGDILLELDAMPLAEFVALEAHLDERVGQSIVLAVERNGEPMLHALQVEDLHAITPAEHIEFGDAVVHELSYQQAWHVNRPMQGIYIAAPGYVFSRAGVPAQSVIERIDGELIATLDDLDAALAKLADGQQAALQYYTLDAPQASNQAILQMDRRWYPAQRCRRDDITGAWPCRELVAGPEAPAPKASTARYVSQDDRFLAQVARSLVLVNFNMPYSVSGVGERHYYGTGVVIDAELGLVVVDRNTVPEAMGDVRLTFAGSLEIAGRVVFIHPLHNIAVLAYDPGLLGDTPVRSARLHSSGQRPGDALRAIGLRADGSLVSQAVSVATLEPVVYPLSRSLRFRQTNLEAISLVTAPRGIDGVLADRRGRIVALWSSFAFDTASETLQENRGFPAEIVIEVRELLQARHDESDREITIPSLEVELQTVPLSVARNYQLADEWAARIAAHDPARREVLMVVRTVAATPSAELLKSGDLLLAIDGRVVTRFREVERAATQKKVDVTVWRNNAELTVTVPTTRLTGEGVRRLLRWGGALLQEPYRDMAAQRGIEPVGVYVAYFSFGSPASRAGLNAGSRIIEVDGVPVADLDDFIARVAGKEDGDSVRLTTRSWNDTVRVVTLKADPGFWPSWQIVYGDSWERLAVPADLP